MNSLPARRESTRAEIVNRIGIAKELIDTVFLENPAVGSIARRSHMSLYHFLRCFKHVYGITPYQYMLGKRLEWSRHRLCQQKTFISAIARECKFPDVSSFSKAFKKKYGCSPANFLKQAQRAIPGCNYGNNVLTIMAAADSLPLSEG